MRFPTNMLLALLTLGCVMADRRWSKSRAFVNSSRATNTTKSDPSGKAEPELPDNNNSLENEEKNIDPQKGEVDTSRDSTQNSESKGASAVVEAVLNNFDYEISLVVKIGENASIFEHTSYGPSKYTSILDECTDMKLHGTDSSRESNSFYLVCYADGNITFFVIDKGNPAWLPSKSHEGLPFITFKRHIIPYINNPQDDGSLAGDHVTPNAPRKSNDPAGPVNNQQDSNPYIPPSGLNQNIQQPLNAQNQQNTGSGLPSNTMPHQNGQQLPPPAQTRDPNSQQINESGIYQPTQNAINGRLVDPNGQEIPLQGQQYSQNGMQGLHPNMQQTASGPNGYPQSPSGQQDQPNNGYLNPSAPLQPGNPYPQNQAGPQGSNDIPLSDTQRGQDPTQSVSRGLKRKYEAPYGPDNSGSGDYDDFHIPGLRNQPSNNSDPNVPPTQDKGRKRRHPDDSEISDFFSFGDETDDLDSTTNSNSGTNDGDSGYDSTSGGDEHDQEDKTTNDNRQTSSTRGNDRHEGPQSNQQSEPQNTYQNNPQNCNASYPSPPFLPPYGGFTTFPSSGIPVSLTASPQPTVFVPPVPMINAGGSVETRNPDTQNLASGNKNTQPVSEVNQLLTQTHMPGLSYPLPTAVLPQKPLPPLTPAVYSTTAMPAQVSQDMSVPVSMPISVSAPVVMPTPTPLPVPQPPLVVSTLLQPPQSDDGNYIGQDSGISINPVRDGGDHISSYDEKASEGSYSKGISRSRRKRNRRRRHWGHKRHKYPMGSRKRARRFPRNQQESRLKDTSKYNDDQKERHSPSKRGSNRLRELARDIAEIIHTGFVENS